MKCIVNINNENKCVEFTFPNGLTLRLRINAVKEYMKSDVDEKDIINYILYTVKRNKPTTLAQAKTLIENLDI